MAAYPLAIYDPPVPLPRLSSWHWRRKFRCPNPTCARDRARAGQRGPRVLGWQQIFKWMRQGGARMGPDGTVEPGAPIVPPVVGYFIEKVWLAHELTDVPHPPDSTPTFELPKGARDDRSLPSRARASPVLASAEWISPLGLPGRGDPYWAERGTPARKRGGMGYWNLALIADAQRPFVVRCPECRRRCLVDGSLPEDELRRLDEHRA